MDGKKVLVVTTVAADESQLRNELADADEIRVVAPAAKISWLGWLTNAEDDARRDAEQAAAQVAESLSDEAQVEVDPTSQNTDAAEDVADALRTLPGRRDRGADEAGRGCVLARGRNGPGCGRCSRDPCAPPGARRALDQAVGSAPCGRRSPCSLSGSVCWSPQAAEATTTRTAPPPGPRRPQRLRARRARSSWSRPAS